MPDENISRINFLSNSDKPVNFSKLAAAQLKPTYVNGAGSPNNPVTSTDNKRQSSEHE